MKVIYLHHQENELIKLATENNRQAQQQIYTHFSPKMLGVCRQYIKDIHQAEDIMITAFMKVFVNIKNFENKGSFEGLKKNNTLKNILVNIVINSLSSFLNIKFY